MKHGGGLPAVLQLLPHPPFVPVFPASSKVWDESVQVLMCSSVVGGFGKSYSIVITMVYWRWVCAKLPTKFLHVLQ